MSEFLYQYYIDTMSQNNIDILARVIGWVADIYYAVLPLQKPHSESESKLYLTLSRCRPTASKNSEGMPSL